MGKEEGKNVNRGEVGGAFESTSIRGGSSAAEATDEAATKATGGNGNAPHPPQFPDPTPNLSLSYNGNKDEDGDEDEKNSIDGKFRRNGERGDGLGLGGTYPAKDYVAASS